MRMKSWSRALCVLCVLCGARFCFSLDREAFSITHYDLDVRIEPEQHRLAARGKIKLRNDSATPQKIAVLQISSSLDWRSIRAGETPVQFVRQPYTSDIDHTGSLSEAVVTLPHDIAPRGTAELDIAYEGVILPDATRLTRIGAPEDTAKSADWDQIDENFTAIRGAGYVAWYPIATESVNFSEDSSLSEVLGRWKVREATSEMVLLFESTKKTKILFSGTKDLFMVPADQFPTKAAFSMFRPGINVPTIVLGDFKQIDVKGLSEVDFLPGKEATAASYADLLGKLDPLPSLRGQRGLQVVQLPYADATPFVTEGLLLVPLQTLSEESRLTLVYALARQAAASPRAWINEGLAHLAQAIDIENEHGRKSEVEYLNSHRVLLIDAEKRSNLGDSGSKAEPGSEADRSLVSTNDELYLQSKAMWVWSMLRDMIGEAFDIGLFSYNAFEDDGPSYMPRMIESHCQRDLSWFFDDWLYHDHGLPNFKVDSAFARSASPNLFVLTITLENTGTAGAEVPVIIRMPKGESVKRIEVRAKSKTTVRVETPAAPQEIVVNDGSVPESETKDNVFKVAQPQS
jgi:hypothetical protein